MESKPDCAIAICVNKMIIRDENINLWSVIWHLWPNRFHLANQWTYQNTNTSSVKIPQVIVFLNAIFDKMFDQCRIGANVISTLARDLDLPHWSLWNLDVKCNFPFFLLLSRDLRMKMPSDECCEIYWLQVNIGSGNGLLLCGNADPVLYRYKTSLCHTEVSIIMSIVNMDYMEWGLQQPHFPMILEFKSQPYDYIVSKLKCPSRILDRSVFRQFIRFILFLLNWVIIGSGDGFWPVRAKQSLESVLTYCQLDKSYMSKANDDHAKMYL